MDLCIYGYRDSYTLFLCIRLYNSNYTDRASQVLLNITDLLSKSLTLPILGLTKGISHSPPKFPIIWKPSPNIKKLKGSVLWRF